MQEHNSVLLEIVIGEADGAAIIPIFDIVGTEVQVEPLKVVVTTLSTTTLEVTGEVHVVLETAKVYVVPATKPPTVVVPPVPVNPVKPVVFGLAIIVQVPEAGKPLKGTFPVVTTQLG